jgi:hypothetical protein
VVVRSVLLSCATIEFKTGTTGLAHFASLCWRSVVGDGKGSFAHCFPVVAGTSSINAVVKMKWQKHSSQNAVWLATTVKTQL